MSKINPDKLLISSDFYSVQGRKIIKVEVPKEIWDADMSIWNILFGRRDIMGTWMRSIQDVIQQLNNK